MDRAYRHPISWAAVHVADAQHYHHNYSDEKDERPVEATVAAAMFKGSECEVTRSLRAIASLIELALAAGVALVCGTDQIWLAIRIVSGSMFSKRRRHAVAAVKITAPVVAVWMAFIVRNLV